MAGQFDARSSPEQIPSDGWREVKNFRVDNMLGKLCRATGWKKLLSGAVTNRDYNNEDLHDQLLDLQTFYDKIIPTNKTSGLLVVGRTYIIASFEAGDDFTNVGATVNNSGISFIATGTTPTTWTHASILTEMETDDSLVMAYPPNNPDFGISCSNTLQTRPQGRQPITFLAQIESSATNRRLAAGTQSRLYVLGERRGNWRIIGDGFGGTADDPSVRWRQTRLGDYVLFTNNYDQVVYWPFDGAVTGCEQQAVQPVPDLVTINLTKAAVIFEFRGIIILANTEEDGTRKSNMVRWSGLDAPLEWIEDPGVSLVGHQELDYGEEILAGEKLGDFAYLYTNRGIWKMAVSNDPAIVFSITKVYSSDTGGNCIKYPFTFVSIGEAHFYMAEDGIYSWSQYSPRPERLEWIHRPSAILYDNLNANACAIHTAAYDPAKKEIYFSCALGTDALPSVTLVCNTQYKHAHKLDHGFTALVSFVPDDRPSVFDWLTENCIVSQECLESDASKALGAVDPKLGPAKPLTSPPCTTYATVFCRQPTTGPNIVTGVWGAEAESPVSVVPGALYRVTFSQADTDIAVGLINPPSSVSYSSADGPTFTFVAASNTVAFVNGGFPGDPVTSTIQLISGAIEVDGVIVENNDGTDCAVDSVCALAGGQSIPELCRKCDEPSIFIGASATDWCLKQFGEVYYREMRVNEAYVNVAYQSRLLKTLPGSRKSEDPLKSCSIQWSDEGNRAVDCLNDDEPMAWNVWASDNFLYLDFTIDGIGGASCYSSMELRLQPAQ